MSTGAWGGGEGDAAKTGEIVFHPINIDEYRFPKFLGGFQMPQNFALRPKYTTYQCGACGNTTTGRVVCDMERGTDGATVSWCLCACDKAEPTLLIQKEGQVTTQLPNGCEFRCESAWPPELAALFGEAIKAYAANAFTATAMVCRKVLMVCACSKGAEDGKNFVYYVDYVTHSILTFPPAQKAIDAIRDIGNDANHDIAFVAPGDAKRAMKIVTYMLNTIYSLPSA